MPHLRVLSLVPPSHLQRGAGKVHAVCLLLGLFFGILITCHSRALWPSSYRLQVTSLEPLTSHNDIWRTLASKDVSTSASEPARGLAASTGLPSEQLSHSRIDRETNNRGKLSAPSPDNNDLPEQHVKGPRTPSQAAEKALEESVGIAVDPGQNGFCTIACSRESWLTDVCELAGSPVRVALNSTEVKCFGELKLGPKATGVTDKIRPLARKFDQLVMQARITEFQLVAKTSKLDQAGSSQPACAHTSEVPGILFSAGGHVGSVFHELSDVLIPLFLTAERFHGKVRLLVSDCPPSWWYWKYEAFLEMLSDYPILRTARLLEEGQKPENTSWCFPSLTVGLEAHDYLTIRPGESPDRIGIAKMGVMLAQKYDLPVDSEKVEEWADVRKRFIDSGGSLEELSIESATRRPLKLGICRREKTRQILNHDRVVQIAREAGFEVEELEFAYTSPSLKEIVRRMRSLDVFFAVHGAAMTHLVFMQPGAVAVQVVPFGLSDAARMYSVPAISHLEYLEYKVELNESSLSEEYTWQDPQVFNPELIWKKGWSAGDIYLHQTVKLNESRVRDILLEARTQRWQSLELMSRSEH